ncbi:hypothetical protein CHLRE_02g104100v5 [Chlamydomonas reinhardtii]|uniref:Non-haem dioxygenase N-terminal domain-containing protein n=1 Tax=Chlamydomonas reinhardtii TaxID=3055 RepID=A0A2K3E2I7_CHLRE|nr:uncharacterized protein CHLRE_02g104100v5 [Chlamydomonas reinhardtii]PNW86984.1 hypothetical protein CHLRE_02g104100v5 [Chlamydomonas reinhardtii]
MQTAAGKGACAPKIAPRVPVCPLVRTSRNSTSARGFIDGRQPIAGGSVAVAKPQSFQERSLVVLDYNDLASGNHLHAQIEEALGPNGLGALAVRNVPGYVARRRLLLPQAHAFANLPEDVRRRYEDQESHYSVGWSHGKESLSSGQPDTYKGSYYANPLVDDPLRPGPTDSLRPWQHSALASLEETLSSVDDSGRAGAGASSSGRCSAEEEAELRRRHPGYYRPNLWPRQELPVFEVALKDLGRLIVAVGCLLMDHCDSYVSSRLGVQEGQLSGVLRRSYNPKARLLHYFAMPGPQLSLLAGTAGAQQPPQQQENEDSWCGLHTDHGSLTGLTSAMYLDASGHEVPNPDPAAGLYIRDRSGHMVRAGIPADCIAFQVGEALQIHSGGLLQATPHFVRSARGVAAAGVSRNTFAVFMQPNVDERMDCPPGMDPKSVKIGQWQPGCTFGKFAEDTFALYYHKNQ